MAEKIILYNSDCLYYLSNEMKEMNGMREDERTKQAEIM